MDVSTPFGELFFGHSVFILLYVHSFIFTCCLVQFGHQTKLVRLRIIMIPVMPDFHTALYNILIVIYRLVYILLSCLYKEHKELHGNLTTGLGERPVLSPFVHSVHMFFCWPCSSQHICKFPCSYCFSKLETCWLHFIALKQSHLKKMKPFKPLFHLWE